MKKKLLIFIIFLGILGIFSPRKSYCAESNFGALALKASEAIPANWHRVLVSGASETGVFSDAKGIIQLLESSGEFKLVGVRKLALPATLALVKAMQNNSAKIGLVLGAAALLHTGFYSFKLYDRYQGNMNLALKEVPHHPAFSFSNLSDSFIPKIISKIIMVPCTLLDFMFDAHNRDNWSLLARNTRWSSIAAYHDGVVWFGLGTAAAAIAGGASHLLTDGFQDHSSLELFFERY